MAKLVFGLNQSLDGYVDHLEMRPSPQPRPAASAGLRDRQPNLRNSYRDQGTARGQAASTPDPAQISGAQV